MNWLSLILFVSLISITIVVIQRSSGVLTNDQKKLNPSESFSLIDKITSLVDSGQEIGRFSFIIRHPRSFDPSGLLI
jgi:hypothetical protein